MTYYLDSFGCVKNQVDSENMMSSLNRAGWTAAENAEDADLIIVNSCGFIESAKKESINAVISWRKLYPGKKILLAGCLAQRYAKELPGELTEADGFFGIDNISGITAAAAEITGSPASDPDLKLYAELKTEGSRPLLSPPGTAYVKISEGCDNHCSFCVIPLIRGPMKSRHLVDIYEECRILLARGIKELCIIAQDSGSYGKDLNRTPPVSLSSLLDALSQLSGKFRVRILYIHPDHFPLKILDLMEQDTRFIPYFDIPFQHGSPKILAAMNRKGNADVYLELIKTIRGRLPDAIIRSTFITGFPGETEEDFQMLLDFQKKASLDWMGCFVYSREEGTPAYDMKDRVTKKIAEERKKILEEQQVRITEKQMDRFVDRTIDVLVEEKFTSDIITVGEDEALYLGRLPCQAPEVDGVSVIYSPFPLKLGAMYPCHVIDRTGYDLKVRPL